jgi:hypothetical protein
MRNLWIATDVSRETSVADRSRLLVAQGFDWIEHRGLARGIPSEEHPDGRGEQKTPND